VGDERYTDQKKVRRPGCASLLLGILSPLSTFAAALLNAQLSQRHEREWTNQIKMAMMKVESSLEDLREAYETIKMSTGKESGPVVPGAMQIDLNRTSIRSMRWNIYTAMNRLESQFDALKELALRVRLSEAHELIRRISDLKQMFKLIFVAETSEKFLEECGRILDACQRLLAEWTLACEMLILSGKLRGWLGLIPRSIPVSYRLYTSFLSFISESVRLSPSFIPFLRPNARTTSFGIVTRKLFPTCMRLTSNSTGIP
jgi:hypothetical protein